MQAGRHPDDEHPRQTGHEQVLAGKGQAVGEVAGIEGLYGGRLQQEAFPEEQGQQDGLALGHGGGGWHGGASGGWPRRGRGRGGGGRGRQQVGPARQEHGKEPAHEGQTLPGKGGGRAADGGVAVRAPAPDAPARAVAVPPEPPVGQAEIALAVHGQQFALQTHCLPRQREDGGLFPCPGGIPGEGGLCLAVGPFQAQIGQADAQALIRQGAHIVHPGFQHGPVAGGDALLVQTLQEGGRGKIGQQGPGRGAAQQGDGAGQQQAGEAPQPAVRHQDAKTRAKRGSWPACRQQAQQPAE